MIQVQAENGHVNVHISGKIYVEEASHLREEMLPYMEEGYQRITIDMANVDYIDSSGLGVLVAIHKRAVQNGGALAVKGLRGSVKELFELTRLTNVFIIQD